MNNHILNKITDFFRIITKRNWAYTGRKYSMSVFVRIPVRTFYICVGTQEPSHRRVVQTGIHVHQAEHRQVFVTRVAPSQKQIRRTARRIYRLVRRVPQLPPGIVTQFLHHRAAAVGDVGNTAQIVSANIINIPTSAPFFHINRSFSDKKLKTKRRRIKSWRYVIQSSNLLPGFFSSSFTRPELCFDST